MDCGGVREVAWTLVGRAGGGTSGTPDFQLSYSFAGGNQHPVVEFPFP